MSLLPAIQQLCNQITGYTFYFDDRQLMNAAADNAAFPCIFFEEYRDGSYRHKHYLEKATRVQLYFCTLCPMHNDGMERERLRVQLEEEAVLPFIRLYNQHPETFTRITDWKFYTPPPRFDANEVSIMLEFNATMVGC